MKREKKIWFSSPPLNSYRAKNVCKLNKERSTYKQYKIKITIDIYLRIYTNVWSRFITFYIHITIPILRNRFKSNQILRQEIVEYTWAHRISKTTHDAQNVFYDICLSRLRAISTKVFFPSLFLSFFHYQPVLTHLFTGASSTVTLSLPSSQVNNRPSKALQPTLISNWPRENRRGILCGSSRMFPNKILFTLRSLIYRRSGSRIRVRATIFPPCESVREVYTGKYIGHSSVP